MQRFHATNCTSAVNNGAVGGSLSRDTSRAESSAHSTNFPSNRYIYLIRHISNKHIHTHIDIYVHTHKYAINAFF